MDDNSSGCWVTSGRNEVRLRPIKRWFCLHKRTSYPPTRKFKKYPDIHYIQCVMCGDWRRVNGASRLSEMTRMTFGLSESTDEGETEK